MKDTAPDPNEVLMRDGEDELRRRFDQAGSFDELCPELDGPISLADFYAHMPTHRYIFAPTREMWPAKSVNARLSPVPIGEEMLSASEWLDQKATRRADDWAPGEPMLIRDRLVADGGWLHRPGCTNFNLYRPPVIAHGNAGDAQRWLDHVRLVYPDEADHIFNWLAHRVQKPDQKINHALVLGGVQGIGKDTLLDPVKHAVGPWNFAEVTPAQLLGRFNGFIKSVILRVSEARDLGEVNRYSFYEHTKVYTAAPPDVLRCDEKNLREHAVFNVCGLIVTTNHKSDGLYLPADDRRHYVAWSPRVKADFSDDYWLGLYAWYQREGHSHVAAFLSGLDLSSFDAKKPPPKTAAFWDIVNASRAPEDAELADALDELGNPDVVTLGDVSMRAGESFREWLNDRRNRRQIPYRLEEAGYVSVRNPAANDGLWKINAKRQVIYGRQTISVRDLLAAAAARSSRR
jgi:hypothetical protein